MAASSSACSSDSYLALKYEMDVCLSEMRALMEHASNLVLKQKAQFENQRASERLRVDLARMVETERQKELSASLNAIRRDMERMKAEYERELDEFSLQIKELVNCNLETTNVNLILKKSLTKSNDQLTELKEKISLYEAAQEADREELARLTEENEKLEIELDEKTHLLETWKASHAQLASAHTRALSKIEEYKVDGRMSEAERTYALIQRLEGFVRQSLKVKDEVESVTERGEGDEDETQSVYCMDYMQGYSEEEKSQSLFGRRFVTMSNMVESEWETEPDEEDEKVDNSDIASSKSIITLDDDFHASSDWSNDDYE